MLQVTFGEVTFQAPETSRFFSIAIDLLNIHKDDLSTGKEPKSDHDLISDPGAGVPDSGTIAEIAKSRSKVGRRDEGESRPKGRWFVRHKPRISLPDGGFEIPENLEQLKAFIASKGLTPHPRGDASMLLWQVRNRLKLQVEAID